MGPFHWPCTERQSVGKDPTDCCVDGVRRPPAHRAGAWLSSLVEKFRGGRQVCAAQLRRAGEEQEGGGQHRAGRQNNVDAAVTQHAVRRHEQRLEARGRRQVCRAVAMP